MSTIDQSPAWALQEAIFDRLSSDPDMLSHLGGPHIYDGAPQNRQFPFVGFGLFETYEYDASDADCYEHLIHLDVWTKRGGRKQCELIANTIRILLHDQPLSLDNFHLINLRCERVRTRRQRDEKIYHADLMLRAVSAPSS